MSNPLNILDENPQSADISEAALSDPLSTADKITCRSAVVILDEKGVDKKSISRKEMIDKMLALAHGIENLPDVKYGDDVAPLVHTFADGMYIRQITMPKGMIIVSKLHKTTHPYFVMSGDVSVLTEDNKVVRIKAPYSGVTRAGTQRVLYIHEETVWTTVHATKETNLEKIEDVVIAKSYAELPEHVKNGGKLLCHGD